jgi:hypothetical protein
MNLTETVQMPIVLGFGRACDPATDIDGQAHDGLDGFQSPVSARLVPEGSSVINFSSGSFRVGRTIPLKLAAFCGPQALGDADLNPNPRIVALEHDTLGPLSLTGINGDNGANPDDPEFSCSTNNCDYQFRTEDLPAGPIIISVEMPDGRVYAAGLTLRP